MHQTLNPATTVPLPSALQTWPLSVTAAAMAFATESIATWRERVLSPWKFNRIFFTDAELDAQIDKVFRCGQSVGGVGRGNECVDACTQVVCPKP